MKLKGSKLRKILWRLLLAKVKQEINILSMLHKQKKDGYEQVAAIFEETANNEKEHAKMWFKELHDGRFQTHTQIFLMLLQVNMVNGLKCM